MFPTNYTVHDVTQTTIFTDKVLIFLVSRRSAFYAPIEML